jgi:hypothetical protein
LRVELLEDRSLPATLTPTTFADGGLGSGSLRDAVVQCNADTGTADDTIQLLPGTYSLTIRNVNGRHETAGLTGDLNLTQTSHRWIIQGAGPSTIIDAGQLQDRVFQIVNPGTHVVFQDLVIQGGLAQDDGTDGALAGFTDALGGGIFNNGGDITLDNVVLQNNRAVGGLQAPGYSADGGGFYSTGGALTVSGTVIANNQAFGGRGFDHISYAPGGNGGSACGGGLYASGSSLDISDSRIASNGTSGGRGGDGYFYSTNSFSLLVRGGYGGNGQGGGLYVNGGSLTIARSTIASNQAIGGEPGAYGDYSGYSEGGGLSNSGTLTLTGGTLSGNSADFGGGIGNTGTLTVTGSTLSGNSGGGIYNRGTLTVRNSTLSGNSGGGIYNGGTLTVSNSTLSGNTAGYGGGIYNYGPYPVTLTNVTLTANRANTGGGLASTYTVLHNTLIAGNFRGASGTTRDDVSGRLDPGGDYNLIGDGTGMTGLSNGVNGNLVGNAVTPIDPLLGPLMDNGGPTRTHALLPGSPAVDAGNNAYATPFDQRGAGFPRVLYGAIDIGAFELARGPLLTVTTTLDVHSEGLLNLREAVALANTDAGRGQSDTVVFDPSLGSATITLSAGPLQLSGASATATEIIDGNGRITVSGADASRVFQIDAGVRAELDGLTITQGRATDAGGGIANFGTLTVRYSALARNAAGSDGGGIVNQGVLVVSNSTLFGNAAARDGGGIVNQGVLVVSNSTLFGNAAARDGGGLWAGPALGPCTLTNVTLSANRADTGGSGGSGGGLFAEPAAAGRPVLHNTLIAGNFQGATGTTRDDVNGALDPGGDYSLIGDGSGMTGLGDGSNGNQVGSADAPIDPRLGPLQDNGGPTPTMALLPDSPALDAGNNSYATPTDQRGPGFPRVLDGRIDIGAFEFAPALLMVTSASDRHIDGLFSLREALEEANRDASRGQSDTIHFDPSLGSATITLSAGPLELSGASATATEIIDGNGRITVSGADASRVFQIDAGVRAELDGLTITQGRATEGGGIYNAGTLTVSNSALSGNSVNGTHEYGGGIYNSGTLTVSNSTLSGNSANGTPNYGGGGIYNHGTMTLSNSTLSGNTAIGIGGGIFNDGTLTVSNSTLSGNSASGYYAAGGGIFNDGTLTVSNSTLSGNSVNGPHDYGGGIYNNNTLTVSNSTLSANSATEFGGGIYNDYGTLTVSNSTLSANSASQDGGGIFNHGTSPVTLTNATLIANRANTGSGNFHGGGLFVYSGTPLLHNTLIAGNFNGAAGTTRDDVYGALDPGGNYNLISDGTGMTGLSNGANGNLVGSASAPIDPLLGDLHGNGGPTLTHALLPGSPALNAGDPSQLGSPDQRGVIRTGGVNIGAFQASAAAFRVGAPDTVQSGVPFDVTVMAVDPFGQVAVGYTGTVTFSTTDPDPAVVLPADYSFQPSDAGQLTFPGGVTLITPGDQTLTVMDTADNTITGSAVITVGSTPPGAGSHALDGQPQPSRSQGSAPPASEPSHPEVVAGDHWFASLNARDLRFALFPPIHDARAGGDWWALDSWWGGDERLFT